NLGVLLTDAHTWATGQPIPLAAQGPGMIDVHIDCLNLMPGTYYLGIWVSSYHEFHDEMNNVATLEIEQSDYYGTGRGIESRFGLIFLPCQWTVPDGNLQRRGSCGSPQKVSEQTDEGNGPARSAVAVS